LTWVLGVNAWSWLAHMSMELEAEHTRGDIVTELFYLFSNVAEESVARPAADHHHDEDRAFAQVHGHGGARADGVTADLLGLDSDEVLAGGVHCAAECSDEFFRGDVFDSVISPDG